MNHNDHVRLLNNGIHAPDGVWADLGSGQGAFTLALADLLTPQGQIYSIDINADALRIQQQAFESLTPGATVHYLVADFTTPLNLPPLDGIIMANALHFVRHKKPVLHQLRGYLKDSGSLIIVEYDTDKGNRWVPFPLSYATWERLAETCGFTDTRLLHVVPSSFLGQFFSAVSQVRPK